MTKSVIRIVVADDHAIVRAGLRRVLTTRGFAVVADAADADATFAAVAAHRPDVLVLDITMPGGGGWSIIERVIDESPSTRILMLSIHDEAEYVIESIRLGAHGYVRKDTTPAELRAAVSAVHEGKAYVSPAVAAHLTAAIRSRSDADADAGSAAPAAALSSLTVREREVLALVADGRTNKQVAALLGISPRTVEAHREALMRKLAIRTVAGLTRFALDAEVAGRRDGSP
jgi:DNA-binding NarL/FixJ family response regulator